MVSSSDITWAFAPHVFSAHYKTAARRAASFNVTLPLLHAARRPVVMSFVSNKLPWCDLVAMTDVGITAHGAAHVS
jgi:hypothetical protein